MNIVVCVKQVPDTATERKLKSDDKTLDREAADGVINELDEYAVEEALTIKEAHGGEVTVLTMGPDKAADSIRKALAMGADKAVHVSDDALVGSDALSTSYALAQALKKIGFDLVILGSESTDARTGMVAAMLAERLGVPQVTLANKVEIDGSSFKAQRLTDYGFDRVEATPARGRERRREDQRAALPLLQGDHGGQEEAGRQARRRRRRDRRRAGRARRSLHRGRRLRRRAAA